MKYYFDKNFPTVNVSTKPFVKTGLIGISMMSKINLLQIIKTKGKVKPWLLNMYVKQRNKNFNSKYRCYFKIAFGGEGKTFSRKHIVIIR